MSFIRHFKVRLRPHFSWLLVPLTAFLLVTGGEPAQAQATRTWVSGVGDDANPCSRTAPCKTFSGAISKTATGGEINCLDPGGFGGITITKSIHIICTNVLAGVLVSGTNAIIVNAPANSKVWLEGLDIEGLGTGLNGIRMLGGGFLTVKNCEIRHFTQRGIDLQGTSGARVYVQDSMIIDNVLGGFHQQGAGGVVNNSLIERTTFDLNGGSAINIVGPGQNVLSGNSITFSPSSVTSSAGAVVQSYGNNMFRNPAPGVTSTIPLQ